MDPNIFSNADFFSLPSIRKTRPHVGYISNFFARPHENAKITDLR